MGSLKRLSLLACCSALAAGILALPAVAAADTSAELERARRERAAIQNRLDRTVADYHAAEARLAVTQDRIAQAQALLTEALKRLAQAQLAITRRANAIYRAGPVSVLQVLLEAEAFGDFVRRFALLERASGTDSAVIIRAQRARAEIEELKTDLEERRRLELQTAARLRSLTNDLGGLFRDAAARESRLLAERDTALLRRQEQERRSRLAATVARRARFSPDGFVCPVDGPTAFTDSWGDPRGGGRRHEGVDMFAARGTPVAAVVEGTVGRMSTSSTGGIQLYLRGGDGTEYFYAHLNGYAGVSPGQRVTAGTHVAFVGNSGNARGGAPHLHFEIHPGGGAPINPYPTVKAACG